jgi:amino acid transporter
LLFEREAAVGVPSCVQRKFLQAAYRIVSESKKVPEAINQLKRALTLRDLVLFNLVAIIGIDWLGRAGQSGPSALTLWLVAAIFFFVPQGLAVAELSSSFPEEGGIYSWTKQMFGERHGFLCGWCYWINNILFYPAIVISAAVIATYAIGKGGSGLGENKTYALIFTEAALWATVLLNIIGLARGKWLQNAGAIGTCIGGAILVSVGIYAFLTQKPANPITAGQFTAGLTNLSSLSVWATIAFAYAGLELSSTMGGEIQNPERNLPLSVYISAPIIAALYILGTGSLLWLVCIEKIDTVGGAFQAISEGASKLGGTVWLIAPAAAAVTALGRIGQMGAWLNGSTRVAFVIGLDRYFPQSFGLIHSRWRTPYVAILVQAVLATLLLPLSVLGEGTTVGEAFLIFINTTLLVSFIPYIYLFVCFFRRCRQADATTGAANLRTRRFIPMIAAVSGLLVTLFVMVIAVVPPPKTSHPLAFVTKVVGISTAFTLLGGLIYWRAKRDPLTRPL